MMKNLLITLMLIAGVSSTLLAQQDTPTYSREKMETPPKRIFWGANLGLLVGSFTKIDIAPYIGYGITSSTDIGAGPFYQYAAYRRSGYSSYGTRVFMRQGVFSNFFAQAEYEYMNTEDPDPEAVILDERERINVNSVFLGVGYYGELSRRTRVHLAVMFNVLDNDYKPYDDPIIRIGFSRYF